eukprot:TRINITY_DN24941_c0_g1_i1.p1 TRINITY_DN24941_c0_g1~~TRINITY_DN24941_c0_g1_i1.p1  ORF type:complete len:395 (+),score=98.49 TRINITY_DN24941_c0_g1_i1:145-1329(+)
MAGNKEVVFITEVDVPSKNPPAPVVSQPVRHVQAGGAVAPLQQGGRYLVKDLYDFPSVQNLKVVNGSNMPFRYLVKPPGRAPVWRMHQGKKVTSSGQKMVQHHAIFTPARGADGATYYPGGSGPSGGGGVQPHTLPYVDRPDAVPQAPSSVGQYVLPPEAGRELALAHEYVLPPPEPQPVPVPAQPRRQRQGGSVVDSVASRRSDAEFYRSRQHRHSTSVVGSVDGGSAPGGSGPPVRIAQHLKRQNAQSSVAPSNPPRSVMENAGPCPIMNLSKDTISAIKKKDGLDVPLGPPAFDAPPPVPSSPPASTVCESHLSQYDNLTSVSMRTPQTSRMTSQRGRGLSQLERSLQREEGKKRAVEKELTALRIRQEALINALSRTQKDELTKKLMEVG